MTQAGCNSEGGSYQGDNTACDASICDNGGCEVGYSPDCMGTCFEDSVYTDWVGDTYCDDGAYIPADYGYGGPAGVAIYLNCDEFQCDGGDCPDCGGGGDPTGACCFGVDCFVLTAAECSTNGGEWAGANTTCGADTCGSPSTCDADVTGDGTVDVGDVLAMISAWGTNDANADVNGDGVVDVSDLLVVIDAWGPCPGGGDLTGACCFDTECAVMTSANCAAAGGSYNGDNSTCTADACGGGGGECEAGWTADCQGTCFPDYVYEAWVGDTYCDDGAYAPSEYGCDECPAGVVIYLNCDAFNCDNGDCDCDGGGDPTGACCVGTTCSTGTEADCLASGGAYQGNNSTCDSDPCSGGGCPAGEIEDCNGNCCPADWVADGYCDDGTYEWNGVAIYLNCDQFQCDGGDCTDCGGGGGCPAGEIEDCNGNCCPETWVGDGYCDDGTYEWNGNPIYLNCDEFNNDEGDCG